MINTKGEWIYTNAEIAYELGIAPTTVNAIGRRLFGGGRIAHWTIKDATLIVEYLKSISVEEDAKRLSLLHEKISDIWQSDMTAEEAARQVDKDLYMVK